MKWYKPTPILIRSKLYHDIVLPRMDSVFLILLLVFKPKSHYCKAEEEVLLFYGCGGRSFQNQTFCDKDWPPEPQTLAGAKVDSPTSIQGADQISGLIVDYLVKEGHNP